MIHQAAMGNQSDFTYTTDDDSDDDNNKRELTDVQNDHVDDSAEAVYYVNRGRMPVDAMACPQDIAYPTGLGLLNASRVKCEEIINKLFAPMVHGCLKASTYSEKARKAYLSIVKKKNKTRVELKTAIGRQLCYVKRDMKIIDSLPFRLLGDPVERD